MLERWFVLTIESILVVDKSGLPIASYPEEVTTDRSVFSGLITGLSNATEQLGIGSVENLKIGGKNYLVKNFDKIFIIIVLSEETNVARWYSDIISRALNKITELVAIEEGNISENVYESFRRVLRRFYESYATVESNYKELERVFDIAYKLIGKKTFELLNSVFLPFIEAKEGNSNLDIVIKELDDPEKFAELLIKGAEYLKNNLKGMI